MPCVLERMDMQLIVNRCAGWLKGSVNKKGTLGMEYQYFFFYIYFTLNPFTCSKSDGNISCKTASSPATYGHPAG